MRRRYGRRYGDTIELLAYPLMVVTAVIVIAIVTYFLAIQRHDVSVVIEDKWWSSTTRVRYDEYSCSMTMDFEGNLVQDCGWDTHTRCSTHVAERELPVTYPEPGCSVRSGDDIDYSVSYLVKYRISETNNIDSSGLHLSEWNGVKVNDYLDVYTRGVSGRLYGIHNRG